MKGGRYQLVERSIGWGRTDIPIKQPDLTDGQRGIREEGKGVNIN